MRRFVLPLVSLLLAACASPPLVVLIGHAGPSSGPAEHLGRDTEQGVRLAVEDLNARGLQLQGRPLQFVMVNEDDGGDPARGVEAATRLVNTGVKGVVGHLNSAVSLAAAPVYAKAGVPMVSPASTAPQLTRLGLATVFRVTANDDSAGRLLGRHAQQAWVPRRLLLVDDRSADAQTASAAFEAGLRDAGGSVTAREFVGERQTDFQALASRALALQADLVFFGGIDTQAAALLRTLDARGWQGRFVGAAGICSSELGRLAAPALARIETFCIEPGGAPQPAPAPLAAFQQRFKDRFGVPALTYAAQAYDATQLLAAAMLRAGSTDAAAVRAALAQTRDFAGASGLIGFDAQGDLLQPGVQLYRFQGRQRQALSWLGGAPAPATAP